MAGTLIHLVQATGKNKFYEIGVGVILLLNVPISYIFLKLGYPAEITMIITIFLSICGLIYKLFFIKLRLNFSVSEYFYKIILKNIFISVVSFIIPFYFYMKLEHTFFQFILIGLTSLISSMLSIFFIGLDKNEKELVINFIQSK